MEAGNGVEAVRLNWLEIQVSMKERYFSPLRSTCLAGKRTAEEFSLPVICCAGEIDKEKADVRWHSKRAAGNLKDTMLKALLILMRERELSRRSSWYMVCSFGI